MTAIDRTAYPRPRARLSREELGFRYDLTETDLTFVRANARGDNGRLLLAVLLKSRRDFGCFPGLGEVHAGIVMHVASQLGLETLHPPTDAMRRSSKLYRYQAAVRAHLGVMPYGKWAERLLTGTILDAAETMSDPADLINRAIQALQSAAVDLPGFSTLDRLVSRLRAEIHRRIFGRVAARLTRKDAAALDVLLVKPAESPTTPFNRLKQAPGPATPKTITLWVERLEWLEWLGGIDRPRPAAGRHHAHQTSPVRRRGRSDGNERSARHRPASKTAHAVARPPASGAHAVPGRTRRDDAAPHPAHAGGREGATRGAARPTPGHRGSPDWHLRPGTRDGAGA